MAAGGLAAGGLTGYGAEGPGGDWEVLGLVSFQGERRAVVGDLQGGPVGQQVTGAGRADFDPQPLPAEHEAEGEAVEAFGQAGREADLPGRVPQAGEAADERDPGTGERGDVHAVTGVVLEVVQVHQGGLAQVVEGQVQVTDLGSDDGLGAGGQGGVPDGERLVVVKVPHLLLRGEL